MHYVYIIYSKGLDSIYKGSTSDLKRRLNKHNARCVKSTKNGVPWKLIYYECFSNKTDAIREENFLKTGQGRKRVKYLLKNTLK